MAERVPVTGAIAGFGRLMVETLGKQRHVRLGIGDALAPCNEAAATLQAGVYAAFGMSDTLRLKG